ncbi:MAG: putative RNA dependent RNA polymerase [Enontekio totivirus 2]|nr:MAG: putative RNA dependent RNA polymerase [Enontekio totivirus 2]
MDEESKLRCVACDRMSGYKRQTHRLVRAKEGDTTSILIPIQLTKPHECLLSTLKRIETLKKSKSIDDQLYNSWMSENANNYQLGNSEACMRLWDEFTKYKCKRQMSKHHEEVKWTNHKQAVELKKCKHHKCLYVKINWSLIKTKEDLKVLNTIWRWSSDADHAKTNVSAADMIWHMKQRDWCRSLYDKWSHLFSTNLYNITACALLFHLVGNPVAIKVFALLDKNKFCCLDIDDYKGVFKALSVAIRRTGHWPNGDAATLEEVTGAAGWELAIGRSMNKTDWEEEKRKRVDCYIPLGRPMSGKKTVETNSEYCADLRTELSAIMRELVGRPNRRESWPDYVEDRQSWCSSGSTGGKRLKVSDDEFVRLNKHSYFENLTKEEMIAWLDEEPVTRATASEKFELGKSRAIYGTQPEDYVISSYVLDGIESNLHKVEGVESGLLGQDFIATMIRRCAAVESEGTECTMIDYADFNYQHTLLAQSLVFETLAEVLIVMNHHPDKIKACQWVAKALLNQECRFPGVDTKYYKILQGMFSGCRATNFINTLLNVAYFRVANKWVGNNLHIHPVKLHNIHQGDDVWISNQSRLWAMAVFETMQASGLIFQPSKQMFDICRGEFLRVVYTMEGCRGYIGRSVGTTIMKPIQGTEVTSPSERAVALNSQVMILKRRGMTDLGCELIWEAIVPYSARSKLPSGALTIPVSYLTKSYLDNGLDLGYPGTAAARSNRVAPIPIMQLGSKLLEEKIDCNMSKDWVNILSRKVKTSLKYEDLVVALHRSNVTDSLRTEDRMQCIRKLEKGLRTWLKDSDFGSVTRNRAIYAETLKGNGADAVFKLALADLSANLYGKHTPRNQSMVGNILRAISSGPFKSLSNTMIATGLGTLKAAEVAIMANTNATLRCNAMQALEVIRRRCNDEVASCCLDGIRAGATKYEAEFHPTILSWIQERSLGVSIQKAISIGITGRDELMDLVADDFDCHIRSAREIGKLKQISFY